DQSVLKWAKAIAVKGGHVYGPEPLRWQRSLRRSEWQWNCFQDVVDRTPGGDNRRATITQMALFHTTARRTGMLGSGPRP
ncbi:MAG: hypothetical protein KJZ87_07670, partial [Thermoguttaceae bacterium]|nr:hypothetical protein [Thermoguttaceae bacterium]